MCIRDRRRANSVERIEQLQEAAFKRFATVLLRDNAANQPVGMTPSALGKEVSSRTRKQLGQLFGQPNLSPTDMTNYGLDEGAIEQVEGGFIVGADWLP